MAAADAPPELPNQEPQNLSARLAVEALEIRRLLGLTDRASLTDIANRVTELTRNASRQRHTAAALLSALSAQMDS